MRAGVLADCTRDGRPRLLRSHRTYESGHGGPLTVREHSAAQCNCTVLRTPPQDTGGHSTALPRLSNYSGRRSDRPTSPESNHTRAVVGVTVRTRQHPHSAQRSNPGTVDFGRQKLSKIVNIAVGKYFSNSYFVDSNRMRRSRTLPSIYMQKAAASPHPTVVHGTACLRLAPPDIEPRAARASPVYELAPAQRMSPHHPAHELRPQTVN